MQAKLKQLFNKKGMTLVELLAVIVILAIVTAIAVPSIGKVINNSRKDAQVSNAKMIINAVKLGVAQDDSEVTSKLGKTGSGVSLEDLVTAGLLDKVPDDPNSKGNKYDGKASLVTKTTDAYHIVLKSSDDSETYLDQDESGLTRENVSK